MQSTSWRKLSVFSILYKYMFKIPSNFQTKAHGWESDYDGFEKAGSEISKLKFNATVALTKLLEEDEKKVDT